MTKSLSWSEKYLKIRSQSIELCKPLSVEDHLAQPIIDVSPPKWHLGHSTWFFETFILKPFNSNYKEFDPRFNFLFNSYYESVGKRVLRDQRANMTRPSLDKIYSYRQYIDREMEEFLNANPNPKALELLDLGLNHEQQHQELLVTDFKYILSSQAFFPVYQENYGEGKVENHQREWIKIPEGIYEIGFKGDGFCFDNELGLHKSYLHEYQISNKLVTNGEYLEFMESGAYEDFRYWHSEAWAWIKENHIKSPLYWEKMDGEWYRFSLSGLQKLNSNEALSHISYYEAYAYAEWKGLRLATEMEWEVAADLFHWGKRWEWTNSAYLPYPNFSKAEGAVGEYNGKFMINQMVLRGASIATPKGHSRKTYRNFFHPNLRWQFTGLRLAK
tara:strand:- start:201 stop:1361 length:1161 start_codon:yes stop_codon:yes gene_type:complete